MFAVVCGFRLVPVHDQRLVQVQLRESRKIIRLAESGFNKSPKEVNDRCDSNRLSPLPSVRHMNRKFTIADPG